ncbi:molybdenum cofactor guanylyltransferase [[Leptolyngbya] sp. PCC 7376]|uniref:molybdenum cofactor guanylyltransferase n=1 Tax=[Leptolyngbya] sp. PCC 7376 TaxID=111781 RepID=UPI00029F4318|nr:molybdenum cofactor guanylyltransferase [[Leptolyngbya] sp. PCC 7376]AFY38195.1 molybdenum cofactor guanylyltransferase [[Leptolyngbya] sp. PCC 7376]
MPENNVVSLIVAGGQSRRMGQDKALLIVDGVPLLQRTVAITSQLSKVVWVSTPWRKEYEYLFSEQVQWVDDSLQQGGLVALAEFLTVKPIDEWILLLACDLPYLKLEQLQKWKQQLTQIPESCDVALVKNAAGFYEPLCGFYRGTVANSLEKYRKEGERSFQKWLATEMVFELVLDDLTMLFNCNTPEDFATLKAQF